VAKSMIFFRKRIPPGKRGQIFVRPEIEEDKGRSLKGESRKALGGGLRKGTETSSMTGKPGTVTIAEGC